MTAIHRDLAGGRWQTLSFMEQMANVGSEIERTIRWREKGRSDIAGRAFQRALELLDLTIGDPRNRSRLRELCRVREMAADHFVFDNEYRSTDDSWRRYFMAFTRAAALKRS
jgi:hypothetical protein